MTGKEDGVSPSIFSIGIRLPQLFKEGTKTCPVSKENGVFGFQKQWISFSNSIHHMLLEHVKDPAQKCFGMSFHGYMAFRTWKFRMVGYQTIAIHLLLGVFLDPRERSGVLEGHPLMMERECLWSTRQYGSTPLKGTPSAPEWVRLRVRALPLQFWHTSIFEQVKNTMCIFLMA